MPVFPSPLHRTKKRYFLWSLGLISLLMTELLFSHFSYAEPNPEPVKRIPSNTTELVNYLYTQVLGRTGDMAGIQYWREQLNAGVSASVVTAAFLQAREYEAVIAPLLRLYWASFQEVPDSQTLNRLSDDVRTLGFTAVADQLLATCECAFGAAELSNRAFVELLYVALLNRPADTDGLNYWVGLLDGGTSRGLILFIFTASDEYRRQVDVQLPIRHAYQAFLNREPVGRELNFALAQGSVLHTVESLIQQVTTAIRLTRVASYDSGLGAGAAEIVTYDVLSQRAFIVNATTTAVDVINLTNPAAPQRIATLNVREAGNNLGNANSVAAKNGLLAVAVEADPAQAPGIVAFYDTRSLRLLRTLSVGALPDMVTFTPDGRYVLTANEGEPNDAYTLDPEGSISIIDLQGGVSRATVRTATFTAFNNQKAALIRQGVRLFGPNATVAQDVEPEYIAVSADSRTAYVTLQENNAVAVVDIAAATVSAIVPLGTKNHLSGTATLHTANFENLPPLGTTATGQVIRLGGFSGLYFEGLTQDGDYRFITHPDRGPNGRDADYDNDGVIERPFVLSDFQPQWVRFTYSPRTGRVTLTERIGLKRPNGTPMTGLPNLDGMNGMAHDDEEPIDLFGNILPLDPFGADLEGIVRAPDGTYWMVDEYRPSIYHFLPDGTLFARYVPFGSNASGVNTGIEALPAELAQRRANRGFEAVAYDNGKIYAFVQSPLDNPDTANDANSRASIWTRIVEFDTTTRTVTAQYLYLIERTNGVYTRSDNVDKIGDAVALGQGRFLVIERDSAVTDAGKYIFHIDLAGATNLETLPAAIKGPGGTLERLTAQGLVDAGIKPVTKQLYVDLAALGYLPNDKPEGLALVSKTDDEIILAVLNDNDFGLSEERIALDGSARLQNPPAPVQLGIITIKRAQMDASDRDSGLIATCPLNGDPIATTTAGINICNWPVQGFFQPDAIASYTFAGNTYLVTANEGDARDYDGFSEQTRIGGLRLDPIRFPNAISLQGSSQLGRLNSTRANGDFDGDGDTDVLYSYGARSLTLWDAAGKLVWDSGSEFERIIAAQNPALWLDSRSDDKGPEPEGVAVGTVNGRTYAFVGLERVNGVMVYDVTDPHNPFFVQWIEETEHRSPEGLTFVPALQSPNGKPLLLVAHEVSGTTVVYQVDPVQIVGGSR